MRVTLQKTKEERHKNRRLVRLAEAVYNGLKEDDTERSKEPWQLICWGRSTVVVHRKRAITLNKDHETMTTSRRKATILKRAEEALAGDLSR